DIEGAESCWSRPGGLRPTDFINFIKTADTEAMYTVNHNGTAKEAAALVAFFNGSVDDETMIGADVRGRNWGKVSDWAQLRSDNGNPDPLNIQYWEIGNEIYGGQDGMGTDCSPYGWEEVWTCDGREYVQGIAGDDFRREGFLEFYNEMKKVDPAIQIGAVGVAPTSDWSDWGNEVVAAAGQVMDFYVIHQYAFFDPPTSFAELLAQPQTVWGPLMADIAAAFDRHADGRRIPIAVTEHNLFAFQDQDNDQLMTRAANMLFMADTIGQMLQNGFAMANQWDLANGLAPNGTDYGLLDAESYDRNPQYYVFPLWARFGDQMLPVNSIYDAKTTLSVYAGLANESTVSVLAINKTGETITADIQIDGAPAPPVAGTAVVVQAPSLDSQTITFNGVSAPSDDLTDAPPTTLTEFNNPLSVDFAPYSITLLQFELDQ
ncbi:MAG: alpha-L-arabinofuranosidase, partial [Chloroflexi bacterium]|nr:alpha-L-arabinofuranosidase [Chloroflexota bacterium]